MEKQRDNLGMLDMMVFPAFCVQDQVILRVNSAAQKLLIEPGTPIGELLSSGQAEYASFTGGCLYLTLNISGSKLNTCISRLEDQDIFILEQEDSTELTSLALAASELREPLSRVMHAAEKLWDPAQSDDALRLNRGLYQILRILGNMSDAGSCAVSHQETVNVCAVIRETFEKAEVLLSPTGIALQYDASEDAVYTLADSQQLERAILNILSNAVKFTPVGGTIHARLTRREQAMVLTIQDSGSGIADAMLPTLFTRYLRQPTVEDSRFGLGLGMVMIRAAAVNHGGTVLVDRPEEGGTRITLTLAIRQNTNPVLRSPVLRVDYAGGMDHALVELSEVLPPECFDPKN